MRKVEKKARRLIFMYEYSEFFSKFVLVLVFFKFFVVCLYSFVFFFNLIAFVIDYYDIGVYAAGYL